MIAVCSVTLGAKIPSPVDVGKKNICRLADLESVLHGRQLCVKHLFSDMLSLSGPAFFFPLLL